MRTRGCLEMGQNLTKRKAARHDHAAVAAVHERCGVYTSPAAAEKLLDWISWTADSDLSGARLLEPCCGDGALVVPAAARLCESLAERRRALSERNLAPRIRAFEFVASEAAEARRKIRVILMRKGVDRASAARIARTWIRCEDFLLAEREELSFSHVVANPPYVRWSSLPRDMALKYESVLSAEAARGDLCLAFLDQMAARASDGALLGVLVSDRWLYSAYADGFRKKHARAVVLERHEDANASVVFQQKVYAYPAMLLMRRNKVDGGKSSREFVRSNDASALFRRWSEAFGSLGAAGCSVRVGPALGNDAAFIVSGPEAANIERGRLWPFVGPREILSRDEIEWRGRYVVVVHDGAGLVDLDEFPKLAKHLKPFKLELKRRSCVKDDSREWFRTIDRIAPNDWKRPKLLVPELAKRPRIAMDVNGRIPSHGVYAIFPGEWPIVALHAVLASGVLGATLHAIAPKVNSQCLRSYKKFLIRVPLPTWAEVPAPSRTRLLATLAAEDWAGAHEAIAKLYSVPPRDLASFATEAWAQRLAACRSSEGARVQEPSCAAGPPPGVRVASETP